jgi:hypothetical protein
MKAESLPAFEPDAGLNRGGANFICGHHAGTQGVPPFILVEGKIQSSGFALSRINNGQETPYRSPYR